MTEKFMNKLVEYLLIIFGSILISCSDDNREYEFPTGNGTIRFSQLVVGEITNVIFTYRNYLIEDKEIKGKRYLYVSDNLGKSWKQFENPYGDIEYFHIYSTGDMMFATKSWCYYIDSELTKITPSQVYDYGGEEFKAVAKMHFFQEGDAKNYIWKLEDVEINVWGDYSLGMSDDPNYIARIWYSTDYGRTIKCAIRFDKTRIDGNVQNCRHTHGVRFDRFDKTFYITTGDFDSQCQLIKGKYEINSDQWIFQRLGSGMYYKLLGMYFDRDNAYLVTDYNYYDEDFQPGLIKCNKNYLYDITHFEYLYRNEDFQALLLFESDMNGNKVITPDGRGKDIYYARDNYNFVKIPTSVGKCILGFTSPNYNGDVYARVGSGRLSNFFNFTRAMRNSGVFDYMRFEEQNSSFFDDDFFFIYQND